MFVSLDNYSFSEKWLKIRPVGENNNFIEPQSTKRIKKL